MTAFRNLLAVALILFGVNALMADDTKPDPKAAKKLAKMKAAEKTDADANEKPKEEKPKLEAKPLKTNTAALTHRIDDEIAKKLTSEKIPASPKADDSEFIRRVYLDLTGTIPPAAKVTAFLENKDAKKREKLIDELLTSPGFGRHMADLWDHLLFQRGTETRAVQVEPLTQWLEERFTAGIGWDQLVKELLTANGTQEDNGATTFFLTHLTADKMVDSTSRLFMGIKMECTQCHNHPFTGWKQNEYWGMAAFFTKVRVQGNTKNANKGATPGVTEAANGQGKQKNLPESGKTLPPKFFQGEQPQVGRSDLLRPVFAKWMTSPDNKFFSRAFANRVWGQLFGSGIVNPIDDMHEEHAPSHPELLAELAKQFSSNGFDVRFMFRAICNSEAYQRTSKPIAGNEKDATLFSHMSIKVLTPEQLYDSLVSVLGEPGAVRGMGKGKAAAGAPKGGPRTPREQFVTFFDPGDNTKATDYESGIPQALRLMNNPFTARNSLPAARELTRGESKDKALDKLYLTALSRRPTASERKKLSDYVSTHSADGYGDILWALLNSSEFGLNH